MLDVILQAAGLILCGVLWRGFKPLGLEADALRRNLTGLVYVLLLPALVLSVLWRAPLGWDAVRVAGSAAAGVGIGLALSWVWYRRREGRAALGALLLASAFPNATYLGLPVLEASLGDWARTIAIQYDLFACTPLLLSLGVAIAARYGGDLPSGGTVAALTKVPALWAALAAVALNIGGVPVPPLLAGWLDMLAAGVVPLMLFSLGLGLQWVADWRGRIGAIVPLAVIQLLLIPLMIWAFGGIIGLEGETLTAVVLEAAMPSMVLGIVLCDRYRLDSALYALAVTVTTAGSMLTLPFWFDLLRSQGVFFLK